MSMKINFANNHSVGELASKNQETVSNSVRELSRKVVLANCLVGELS